MSEHIPNSAWSTSLGKVQSGDTMSLSQCLQREIVPWHCCTPLNSPSLQVNRAGPSNGVFGQLCEQVSP